MYRLTSKLPYYLTSKWGSFYTHHCLLLSSTIPKPPKAHPQPSSKTPLVPRGLGGEATTSCIEIHNSTVYIKANLWEILLILFLDFCLFTIVLRYESWFWMVKTNLAGSRAKKVAMNSNRRRTSAQRTSTVIFTSNWLFKPTWQSSSSPYIYCVFVQILKRKIN